jgi:predicted ATP-grasp superfamily ATP-dependent carboligase
MTSAAGTPPASAPIVEKPVSAVVLGSDYRALAAVRSLGRHGVPVHVIAHHDDRLATFSRYTTRRTEWPRTEADQLALLLRLANEGSGRSMLLPSHDELAAFVARHHSSLSGAFALTTPAWATFRLVYDKRATYGLAETAGVDFPLTFYPRDRSDVEHLELGFPMILKPAVKADVNGLTIAKAWRVDDRQELLRRYDEACILMAPELLMIQELVPGGGEGQLSFAALAESGVVLQSLVARRTRQYPAEFGRASTFVETIDDPGLAEPSRRLIAAAGFSGLIELEYKVHARSGRTLLLDVNPRVWGWHGLCARAGVDFPWLLWQHLRGEDPPATQPRVGARWVRLSTDVPTSLREIARGRLSARSYVASLRPPHDSAVFARDDPRPALVELPLLLRTLFRRIAAGEGV